MVTIPDRFRSIPQTVQLMKRSLLLCLTPFLVFSLPASQTSGRPFQGLSSASLEWDPAGSGSFEEVGHGDFDGDGFTDVVTRRGQDLEVFLAPGSLAAPLSSFSTPGAFTVAHDPALLRDVLIVAETSGLKRYAFDLTTKAWSATVLSSATSWSNAAFLTARPQSGLADQIVGVMSGSSVVRAMTNLGGGYVEEPLPIASTPQAILGLEAFDQDGDGVYELALMHTGSVSRPKAIGAAGSETWSVLDTTSFAGLLCVDIARGAQTTGGAHWLGWLLRDSGGICHVAVLSNEPPVGPTLIGSQQIVRIAAGDWTGDGADDLVLSWRVDQRFGVLSNVGTTNAAFDPLVLQTFDLTTTPGAAFPTNSAEPVFADLDNDADLDIGLCVQGDDTLHVEYNQLIDATAWMPTLYTANSLVPADTVRHEIVTSGVYDVDFDLNAPDQWRLDVQGNEIPLDLEVDLWSLAAGGTPEWQLRTTNAGVLPVDHPVTVSFQSPETAVPYDTFYIWRSRYVERDAGGSILFSSPGQLVAFHAAGDPTSPTDPGPGMAADQVIVDWGGIAATDVELGTPGSGSGPFTRVGSALTIPRLPTGAVNDPPL